MSNLPTVERVKENTKPESRRNKIIRWIFGILAVGALIAIFVSMYLHRN